MNSPQPDSIFKQTRFCRVCNSGFLSNQPKKAYCSNICKKQAEAERARAAYRAKTGSRCKTCHEPFEPTHRHQRRCQTCERRTKPVRPHSWPPSICETCTKPIEVRGRRYCSHACWVAERYERRCTSCGCPWNPTERPFSQAATECWLCRSASHVEGGREWDGVKTFRKRQLVKRENGRCQDCGVTEAESGLPHHAHHVKAQALNGSHDLANLKLLCEDCHSGSGWARNHADLIAAGLVIPPVGAQLALAA